MLELDTHALADLERLAVGVDVTSATATLVLVMQGLMALSRTGGSAAVLQERAEAALSVISA